MVEKVVSSEILTILRKALDATSLKHQVLADNIANVNTPGFKRSDVVFQQELKVALFAQQGVLPLATTDKAHFQVPVNVSVSDVKPRVIMHNDTISRNDLNNVDVDLEMSKVAENTILYSALAQITSLKLNALKNAIKEGR